MKKNTRLVLLAVMLVLMLGLTVVMASAAYDVNGTEYATLAEAVAAAPAGGTVTLKGNSTENAGVILNKDITINGAGHKLIFTAGTEKSFVVSGTHNVKGYVLNIQSGAVKLENLIIEAPNDVDNSVAMFLFDNPEAGAPETKTNFSINNVETFGGWMNLVVGASVDITIDGEKTFLGHNSGHQYVFGGAAELSDNCTITIKNGTLKHTTIAENGTESLRSSGDLGTWLGKNSVWDIKSGSIESAGDSLWITGKNYTLNISGGYICSSGGNTVTPNALGVVNITGGHVHAIKKNAITVRYNGAVYNISGGRITTETGYAIYAQSGTTTANISGDVHISGTVILLNSGTLNIDGGLFDKATFSHGRGSSIIFTNNSTPTVNINGGTFILEKGAGDQIVCQNQSNSRITINGGIFTVAGADNPAHILRVGNGYVTISGGTFNHEGTGSIIVDNSDASVQDFIVNAGDNAVAFNHTGTGDIMYFLGSKPMTFNDIVYDHNAESYFIYIGGAAKVTFDLCRISGNGNHLVIKEGAGATLNFMDNVFTSTTGPAILLNGNAATSPGTAFNSAEGFTVEGVEWTEPSFQIGEQTYGSIRGAIAMVKDGETILILKDFTYNPILKTNATYTIDGQGHTMSGYMQATAGHVTVKNLQFHSGSNGVTVSNVNASVIIEDCTIYFVGGDAIAGAVVSTGVTAVGMTLEQLNELCNLTIKNTTIANVKGFKDDGSGPLTDSNGEIILLATGGACVRMLDGAGRIDVISGEMWGSQAWFRINVPGIFNIGDPSLETASLYCREAAARAIWLHNGSFGGEVNIKNGDYSLARDGGATIYINCAGATLNVSGGVYDGFISIFSMHDGDCVSPVNISGGTFNMQGSNSVVTFSAPPSKTESNNTYEKAGHLHISGGTFNTDPTCNGDLISVTASKKLGTVRITGGTFNGGNTRLIFAQNARPTIEISGGEFHGAGIRLFYFNGSNNVTISGGKFVLDNATADSKDCVIHIASNAKGFFSITGGDFVNNRASCKPIILIENDLMSFHVGGGTYYNVNENGYFVLDAHDSITRTIPVDKNAKADFAGASYYVMTTKAATSTSAPVLNLKPIIRLGTNDEGIVDAAAQGIRFSAYMPANVVASLKETGKLSYGTLIMPYDNFKSLGSTDYHAELAKLAAGKDAAKVYADVAASKGLISGTDGSISFYASIVNIKKENWNKKLIAVAYVKVTNGDNVTYHYSGALDSSACSMVDVVNMAIKDVTEEPEAIGTKAYAYYSVYDNGEKYSRYSKTEQYSWQKYLEG